MVLGTVDLEAAYGSGAAAAMDASGTIHVAYGTYLVDGEAVLRHAREDGGTWTFETVETGGFNPSMAIDEAGAVHILHMRIAGYAVRARRGALRGAVADRVAVRNGRRDDKQHVRGPA